MNFVTSSRDRQRQTVLQDLSNRRKRSVFPFIGDLMSALFGTSTHSDVKQLKKLISSLATSQNKVLHVVEESVTILNKTHHQVNQNRIMLNQLNNATTLLGYKVKNLENEIKTVVEPELVYIQLTEQIHEISHIISSALRVTRSQLLQLSSQVSAAITGTFSTSMVKPIELGSILRGIKKQLPSTVTLPYYLSSRGLREYYQNLHTILLPDRDSFHVILALPIVDLNDLYNIYEVINMPVINPKYPNLSAEFHLETKYLAMSTSQTKYTLLSPAEAMVCTKNKFCMLRSPAFKVDSAPKCILSLFHKSSSNITKFCKKKIFNSTPVPTVRHMIDGIWLISTSQTLKIVVTCPHKKANPRISTEIFQNGTGVFRLNEGCYAENPFFTLPTYVRGASTHTTESQLTEYLRQMDSMPNVWTNIEISTYKSRENQSAVLALNNLEAIDQIPFHNLIAILAKAHVMNDHIQTDAETNSFNIYLIVGIIIIMISILITITVVIIYMLYFKKKNYLLKSDPSAERLQVVPDTELDDDLSRPHEGAQEVYQEEPV